MNAVTFAAFFAFIPFVAAAQEAPQASTETARPKSKWREPLNIGGAMLTPTAYRAWGKPGPGLSADLNAAYYIGRLYGRNSLAWTSEKTNFIDRLGVWFLSVDGKMQIQPETRWIPAAAFGAEGVYVFRDAPQPSVQTPGVAVKVTSPETKAMSSAYGVLSKKVLGQYWSLGFQRGNGGHRVAYLSEFLTPEAQTFSGRPGAVVKTSSVLFGSVILFPDTTFPIKVEHMSFQGAHAAPSLTNFRIGSLLHLNFDVSYLKFQGGYDLLGMFGFRYSLYPKRK